ncbi:MAG: hypothetical protein K8S23_09730 [Candidatus Cloacimonetes bacterium]|nr:hypothetical protein [Candidatus Cloacimonadota bacterium]
MLVIHIKEILKIDFIIRKNNEYRRNEFERKNEIQLGDLNLSIVTKEDLIISKLIWGYKSKSELQKKRY